MITLPAELRQKHGIEEGDILRLVDLKCIFVLTPTVPMVPELTREIERLRLEAGLSIQESLEGLRERRARHHDRYGRTASG